MREGEEEKNLFEGTICVGRYSGCSNISLTSFVLKYCVVLLYPGLGKILKKKIPKSNSIVLTISSVAIVHRTELIKAFLHLNTILHSCIKCRNPPQQRFERPRRRRQHCHDLPVGLPALEDGHRGVLRARGRPEGQVQNGAELGRGLRG